MLLPENTCVIYMFNISLYAGVERKSYLEECHCPLACDLLHREFLWKYLASLGQQLYEGSMWSVSNLLLPKGDHRALEFSWYHDFFFFFFFNEEGNYGSAMNQGGWYT